MSDTAQATIARAAVHYSAGEIGAAMQCAREIVARDPEHFDALHLLGVLCLGRRQVADSVCYLTRALRAMPDNVQANLNLGNAWLSLQAFDRAEAVLRRVAALQPDSVDALNDLGIALTGLHRPQDALAVYRTALALQPNRTASHFNCGNALVALGHQEDALARYRQALASAPDDLSRERLVAILHAIGGALVQLDRPDEALALFAREQAIRPYPLDLVWNRSLLHLQIGDYAAGWRDYESRWAVEGHDKPRPDGNIVDLATVAGKRILVVGEQGRGDVIQFARYGPLLSEHGGTVYLSVYDDLKRLLSSMHGIAQVFGESDNEPAYDLATPMLSLPLAFGTTLDTVPASVPYLHAEPERVAAWRKRLGPGTMRHVGLVWSSTNPGAARSTALQSLRPVLDCPNIVFHALQTEIDAADLAFMAGCERIQDHRTALTDFAETAAAIAAFDLTIAIDTGIAHLAGALGRPVWVMLPHIAEWRWLRHRADSPWYPTARLFRQARPGDWHELACRVAAALEHDGRTEG